MAVYVDELWQTPPGRNHRRAWPWPEFCHMAADTPEELQAMAVQLSLQPRWLQHRGTHKEHYDLNRPMRQRAISSGAIPISSRKMGEFMLAKKKGEDSGCNSVRA